MGTILNSERMVRSLRELQEFWTEFIPHISERSILLMSGDVGVGKTTSVQMIAEILGMHDVQSPSFAIHLRYENPEGRCLDHLDLYRLKDDDDLESSGFWDIFAQKQSLVIIEWAQRLDYDYLPLNWQRVEVKFEKLSAEERKISCRLI